MAWPIFEPCEERDKPQATGVRGWVEVRQFPAKTKPHASMAHGLSVKQ
jgi:hypothetical protein